MTRTIKAVLFDLDGTLLDHETAAETAVIKALRTTPGLATLITQKSDNVGENSKRPRWTATCPDDSPSPSNVACGSPHWPPASVWATGTTPRPTPGSPAT